MNCTVCGHTATKVVDSRESRDSIRRRRECLLCEGRFTTYERIYNPRLQVEKRNGNREVFSREKLSRSLAIACVKRPIPLGSIDRIVDEIRDAILLDGRECVETSLVGEMALHKLRDLDDVAYMRYASVYRDFDGVDSFSQEAERLRNDDASDDLPQGRLMVSDALHEMHGRGNGNGASVAKVID